MVKDDVQSLKILEWQKHFCFCYIHKTFECFRSKDEYGTIDNITSEFHHLYSDGYIFDVKKKSLEHGTFGVRPLF